MLMGQSGNDFMRGPYPGNMPGYGSSFNNF